MTAKIVEKKKFPPNRAQTTPEKIGRIIAANHRDCEKRARELQGKRRS